MVIIETLAVFDTTSYDVNEILLNLSIGKLSFLVSEPLPDN